MGHPMMSIHGNLCHYPSEEEQQNEERRKVRHEYFMSEPYHAWTAE
jgi:hypothetical protein